MITNNGKCVALILLSLLGFQAYGAGVNLVNNMKQMAVVELKLSDGKGRSRVLNPGDEMKVDAFFEGFTEIKWMVCGKIYTANPDIPGWHMWHTLRINEGGRIFKDRYGLDAAKEYNGTVVGNTSCDCVITPGA